MENSDVTRRNFIKTAARRRCRGGRPGGAGSLARALGANDRLRIGFIGPGGRGFGAHVKTLTELRKEGANIDLVAVSEVYSVQEDKVCKFIKDETGIEPKRYTDYHDMLADKTVDAVCIGTPDHWHAKQTINALNAGLHVYCEKPMTHTVEEAMAVVDAWRSTGKIMQVGVQSTSLPVWDKAREMIDDGKLGHLLQFQTEYYRNSNVGQWRYYQLNKEMSPKTVDWQRWLGVKEGLAPDMPFDRSVYAQWRCYWPFGSGMYTDLFVHRTTSMLKATGLRFPARVVGAGGIFLEYDGRDVPDVATVVADYKEGCQLLVTSTMCNEKTPIQQVIRGHFGSFIFGTVDEKNEFQVAAGENFNAIQFVAERPQVTLNSKVKSEVISFAQPEDSGKARKRDTTFAHFKNWLTAIREGNQQLCNNPPDLGAAAITTVTLGSRSYREGKVFFFDDEKRTVREADGSWAAGWEKMSKEHAKPAQVAGWKAGDYGSLLVPPKYMDLAGPWINGVPPEEQAKSGG